MPTAYALRADYAGDVDGPDGPRPRFLGGLLAVTGTQDFNVREELDAGGGTIVVDDDYPALLTLLDSYPALKRVPAPDAPARVVTRHDRMTTEALREELRIRGEQTSGNRPDLVSRLEGDDAPPAADSPESGDLGRAGDPATGGPGEPADPDPGSEA